VSDEPALDVTVVSYRCRDLLRDCLASLREHPPQLPISVWVVDNASGDGTVEMVHVEFPEVGLLARAENEGFARATNRALREGSAPYALVLNPDTRMRAGTLDRLLALMAERPEVGIVGCRIERPDGRFDHASRRSFPTPLGALAHFLWIGRRVRSGPLAQYRAVEVDSGPVDAVNGAFMLIRRQALDEVGLFDEGYWMYMEDLDLCYRFKRAGWTTWYEPSVSAVHVKHGTTGRFRSPRLVLAFHYGMFRFYRKHRRAEQNALLNLAVYAGIGTRLALALVGSLLARLGVRARTALSAPQDRPTRTITP
jgi:N-acetylglucosaminyl-diphospho-decaprenol L-rhamnosyltransferase